ncbi:restriction endonuclease subunit S [Actinocrinis puniceicyclus]|uniref:Restriction endonuclease subunit S n=1 Tax=Actinocrinis puniceicyclus TaxID=977794 RepID=A0A8J7WKG4_9ACTN|nr:restriction endonuclease subunit S [Actinocrinis puniceicyclus]MBS2963958.1 restriction endonuclease subunit S [Actinocrinis puniceicyclus]
MTSDTWTWIRLDDLCEIAPGPSGTVQGELSEGVDGVPVLTPPEITADHTIDARAIRMIPQRRAVDLAKFRLLPGDLVCVRQGSLGRTVLIGAEQESWLYGSACMRLRVRPEAGVLSAYLHRYMAHPPVRDALIARANPGTVPTLNKATFAELLIALPGLAEQRAVAGALDAIDTQAESYRQMARRYEAMRPALLSEFLGDRLPEVTASGPMVRGPRRNSPSRRGNRLS